MQSFSVPAVIGISIFIILLALTSPLVSAIRSKNTLGALFLLAIGSWMLLNGLHLRRDRHAFRTRYVLTDEGIQVNPADLPAQTLSWTQFTGAYHSRLLRYLRLSAPSVVPDVVLIFGAPPKPGRDGQPKYVLTRNLIAEKLGDRYLKGWL
jgi:hypothetical protein